MVKHYVPKINKMKSLLTKTLENGRLTLVLSKMLKHFDENQFVKKNGFGFNGRILQENIRNEWFLSNLHRCDEPTFWAKENGEKDINDGLVIASKMPFSLVCIRKTQESKDDLKSNEEFLFNLDDKTILEKRTFCMPALSTAFFHKQQRERRIWWRRFSSLPGRFSTTEISTGDSGDSSVEIRAEFVWCTQTVEFLKHEVEPNLKVKEGRSLTSAHVISSQVNLELATSVYMCDAYDPVNEENSREMMRFYRKLAPYKVAFAVQGASITELSELALVLARKLRQLAIPCLLLPDLGRKSLDSTFKEADAMGIPYTVVLSDSTLLEGILELRSRDTTLKEQSHVSIVVSYIEKIMKS